MAGDQSGGQDGALATSEVNPPQNEPADLQPLAGHTLEAAQMHGVGSPWDSQLQCGPDCIRTVRGGRDWKSASAGGPGPSHPPLPQWGA